MDINEKRLAALAKAREAAKAKREQEKLDRENGILPPKDTKKHVNDRTVYFDAKYHDYLNFVEGMKVVMSNMEVKTKNDVSKCVQAAEEFVKICQSKYPSN